MFVILSLLTLQAPTVIWVTPRGASDFVEPQVSIEDDGHVYIAYGTGDSIFVSTSADKGNTFAAPVKVAESGKISLGMRRGPRIVAYKGEVTVTAVYGSKGRGADGDILTFLSKDHGATWAKAGNVNDLDGAAREGLHAMAVHGWMTGRGAKSCSCRSRRMGVQSGTRIAWFTNLRVARFANAATLRSHTTRMELLISCFEIP
jgi:hypothetical protein